MRPQKMDRPNEGITCSVNTCYYYMKGDRCSASQIHVSPRGSTTSEQTDCDTFYYNKGKA
jgi:hypothetical protein